MEASEKSDVDDEAESVHSEVRRASCELVPNVIIILFHDSERREERGTASSTGTTREKGE